MANFERYTYRVIWSEEDQEFVALCAEFPSLSYLHEGQEQAFQGIRELVEQVVEDLESEGVKERSVGQT